MLQFLLGIWIGAGIILLTLGSAYLCRFPSSKVVVTASGCTIQLSPMTFFLERGDFDRWTWEVCFTWVEGKNYLASSILQNIRGTNIIIIDQPHILIDYNKTPARLVWGVAYPITKTLYLCSASIGYDRLSIRRHVEYLYKHELSHIIMGYIENMWSEEQSHPVFRDLGFKYAEND